MSFKCPKSIRKYGTSQQTSEPAYYIVDCQISSLIMCGRKYLGKWYGQSDIDNLG